MGDAVLCYSMRLRAFDGAQLTCALLSCALLWARFRQRTFVVRGFAGSSENTIRAILRFGRIAATISIPIRVSSDLHGV